jgi:hypothetical protein
MTEQDQLAYLANAISIANADSSLSPKETAAIEEIRVAIGAKKSVLTSAMKAATSSGYTPAKVGSFALQVSNAADMLYIAFVDGELNANARNVVTAFCKKVGLTQEQLNLMAKEAIARSNITQIKEKCPSCRAELLANAKFCPSCGKPTGEVETAPASTEFQIPIEGYAIEFCESTAVSFPDALKQAKDSPTFASLVRSKKVWYCATWRKDKFEAAYKVAQHLGGVRNKKAYLDGHVIPWEDLFGFISCAEERSASYRPTEFCFGKDENRLNPWGCKLSQMDWTAWSRWFSYGKFVRSGVLTSKYVWVFDKERIKHELMANLRRSRYCPFIRLRLLDAVLHFLPEQVDAASDKNWEYSRIYEEVPGAIKIVEAKKDEWGDTERNEYFADGVRPKGLGILQDLLTIAFKGAQVYDVTVSQLIK